MNFTSTHTHGQHVYEGTKHGERGNAHSTLGERLLISVEVVNLRRASCRMGDDSAEARSLDGGIDREVYTHTQIRYD
jgi:ribosomal protein L24